MNELWVKWLPAGAQPARAQPAVLRIALVPFLSPAVMLAAFRPLREHLGRELGRVVEFYTARSYAALLTQIQHAPDEITLLPAHVARLAQLDWGFTPLAATLEQTLAQLLVRAGSGWADAQALRGRTLGVLDRRALPALIAMTWLDAQGLAADRDYRVVVQPSADSALHALARGTVDAVALAASQLQVIPPSTPRGERVLADAGAMPGPVYVAPGHVWAPTRSVGCTTRCCASSPTRASPRPPSTRGCAARRRPGSPPSTSSCLGCGARWCDPERCPGGAPRPAAAGVRRWPQPLQSRPIRGALQPAPQRARLGDPLCNRAHPPGARPGVSHGHGLACARAGRVVHPDHGARP